MIAFLLAESHSHFICIPTYTSLLSLLHCYFSGWESDSLAVWKSRYCQETSLNTNEFIKNKGSLKYYHNLSVPNKNVLSLNQHILQLSVWLSFPVIASDVLCIIWDICTKYTQSNLSGKDFFHTSPNLSKYIWYKSCPNFSGFHLKLKLILFLREKFPLIFLSFC